MKSNHVETVHVDGEIRTVGRPDHNGGGTDWMRTVAKRHPAFVYGRRMGMLLHTVARMELQWWTLGDSGNYWVRRTSPKVYYTTKCGMFFFGSDPDSLGKKPPKALVCELPKPDAVLCGRCQGKGPTFAKGTQPRPGGPTRKEARARIGCVAVGESGLAPDG